MIDATACKELAETLREQGRDDQALAIEAVLDGYSAAANSAHDARKEIVKQRAQISSLEAELGAIQGIRYQEMRLQLPEGGHVTLRWPDSMAVESAEMIREMVDVQMKHHIRVVERIDRADATGVVKTGEAT